MTTPGAQIRVHGTAIAVGDCGLMLRGPSGAGKSDLALRLISTPPAVVRAIFTEMSAAADPTPSLVGDDQVVVTRGPGRELRIRAAEALRGLLEIRGLGVVTVAYRAEARLLAVIDLVGPADVERMPPPGQAASLLECELPCVSLTAFEASAPLKVFHFLALAASNRVGFTSDRVET